MSIRGISKKSRKTRGLESILLHEWWMSSHISAPGSMTSFRGKNHSRLGCCYRCLCSLNFDGFLVTFRITFLPYIAFSCLNEAVIYCYYWARELAGAVLAPQLVLLPYTHRIIIFLLQPATCLHGKNMTLDIFKMGEIRKNEGKTSVEENLTHDTMLYSGTYFFSPHISLE